MQNRIHHTSQPVNVYLRIVERRHLTRECLPLQDGHGIAQIVGDFLHREDNGTSYHPCTSVTSRRGMPPGRQQMISFSVDCGRESGMETETKCVNLGEEEIAQPGDTVHIVAVHSAGGEYGEVHDAGVEGTGGCEEQWSNQRPEGNKAAMRSTTLIYRSTHRTALSSSASTARARPMA